MKRDLPKSIRVTQAIRVIRVNIPKKPLTKMGSALEPSRANRGEYWIFCFSISTLKVRVVRFIIKHTWVITELASTGF